MQGVHSALVVVDFEIVVLADKFVEQVFLFEDKLADGEILHVAVPDTRILVNEFYLLVLGLFELSAQEFNFQLAREAFVELSIAHKGRNAPHNRFMELPARHGEFGVVFFLIHGVK